MMIKKFSWLLPLSFLTACGGSDDFVRPVNSADVPTEDIVPSIGVRVTSGAMETRKTVVMIDLTKQGKPDRLYPIRLSEGDELTATVNGETTTIESAADEYPDDYGAGKYTAELSTTDAGTEIQIALNRESETPAENTTVQLLDEPELSVTTLAEAPTIEDEIEVDWVEEPDYHYHLSLLVQCGDEARDELHDYYYEDEIHADPPLSFALTDLLGSRSITDDNCYLSVYITARADQSTQLDPIFTDGTVYSARTRGERIKLTVP